MDLRHLRYFVAVAEAGGVTAAARRLLVAQSAVSRSIQGLERELGDPLFDRHGRGLKLTDAGVLFLGEARAVLARLDLAVARVQVRDEGPLGTLTLGAPSDLPPGFITAWGAAMSAHDPPTRADFRETHSSAVADALLAGRLHAGLVRLPFDHPQITSAEVITEAFRVELDAHHPLAEQDEIELRDLEGSTWLAFEREQAPAWYDEIAGLLTMALERPLIRATGSDRDLKLEQLRFGPHYAFAPAWHNERATRAGCVQRRLSGDPIRRRTALAWAAHHDIEIDGPLTAAIASTRLLDVG